MDIVKDVLKLVDKLKNLLPQLYDKALLESEIANILNEKYQVQSIKRKKAEAGNHLDVGSRAKAIKHSMKSASKLSASNNKKRTPSDANLGDVSFNQDQNNSIPDDKLFKTESSMDDPDECDFDEEYPHNQTILEEVLSESNAPKFFSRFEMMNYFRKEENLILMLDFIFNPFSVPIMEIWVKKYPEISHFDKEKHINPEMRENLKTLNDPFFLKYYNHFYFRSYRTMVALTLIANYRFVFNSAPGFVDSFFRKVSEDLLDNTESCDANIDHIASIIMSLLAWEPLATINYFIYYNLPYHFIKY